MDRNSGFKRMLAVTGLKARREEVKLALSFTAKEELENRLKELDKQIDAIENPIKRKETTDESTKKTN